MLKRRFNLLDFSHGESKGTVAKFSKRVYIFFQGLNISLALGRSSQRDQLLVSSFGEDKYLLVSFPFYNNAHHLSVRGELKDFQNPILLHLAPDLNFDRFSVFGDDIGNSRGLSSKQQLNFILRNSRKGWFGGAWQVNLQNIVAYCDTPP